ncbi:MAG: OadG family protein [Bacteroidaceae bacterium]|nr:OadG family protein [Bacteroidaceae bacterium]
MDNLNLGLQLLVVGMSTVFVILLIVIYGGKLLINVVNRLAPEEMQASVKKVPRAVGGMPDASTMAILNEVVRQLTGGKGHVERARKI